MTTPTREQVIEWALLTDPEIFHPDINLYEDDIDFLLAFSLLAMSAGREQGLREAAERARSEGITGISADDDEIVADWLEAAAIEQLRGK